jgi:aspartyl-tRNA(Asn)/glutamyl-tRNA(Gln) amidotransferase subunit B
MVEIKNINSFRYVEKALEYEQQRITETLKNGGQIAPETRGWNLSRRETFSMRSKEGEADYRYFPEPDIPPLSISEEFVQDIRRSMPELPQQKTERFIKQYSLPAYDAQVLCSSRELASYFEECAKAVKDSKFASNWIMTEVMKYINETEDYSLRSIKVGPSHYGELEELISSGKISTKIAKDVFPMMMESGKMPGLIVKEKGLEQIDNDELIVNAAKKVIQENTDAYQRYKSGKVNLLGFFVGQVMKETRGKANPEKVNQTVRELLDS